jgi:integrase
MMIYKPKGRRFYMVKFRFEGKLIHKATKATTMKDALDIQARVRTELAKGNWGILEAKATPTLTEFLRRDFLPYVESKHATKPATLRYYKTGANSLMSSNLASLRLDGVTDQQAGQYAACYSNLSPSTINCGLRTLRRALYLASEWGKIDRRPKITLARGERQRDRVLTDSEISNYLGACEQPWHDAASIMLGTGCRPGEVFALRWEHVVLNDSGGLMQVAHGKSKAARRLLPMIPAVHTVLEAQWEAQGRPLEGWVFPAGSRCGHFERGTAKGQHARALTKVSQDAKKINRPGLKPFEPYCLRHTALTRLAESGCDAFTLARIAGHSSITITQRYCHPQADAIERAFAKLSVQKVVSDGGQQATQADTVLKQLTA